MDAGRAALAAVVVCVLVAPTTTVVAQSATVDDRRGPVAAGVDAGTDPTTQVETDQIRLVVTVRPDGDAAWQVEYRTNLDDRNTTEAFESLAEDIEATPGEYTTRFADRIRTTVRSAENATGREMSVQDVTVSARTDSLNGQGVITYTYEWTNFATVDGDRVVVGDSVEGFFLNDRTSLTVQWPEGYGLVEVDPDPADRSGRSLTWRGTETEFGPDQPRVVVREGVTTATTTGDGSSGDGTDGTDGTAEPDTGGDGIPIVLVGVVLAVVVVVATVLARGRIGGATATADDGPGDDGGTAATEAVDDGDGGERTDETPTPVDEELLSNEERVLGLLERRGGRIKQQEIVEALDWTEAKTSQVVSGMREEGTIEGFRLGRENVLTLPEEDPVADDEQGRE